MGLPSLLRKIGWLLFTLMWIPFITIFIGMANLPTGSYAWEELPFLARVSIIAVGIMGVSAIGLLLISPIMSSRRNRVVLASGKDAEATIVSIEPTGTTVNNYYVGMNLALNVRPLNDQPFQTRTERLMPMHMMAKYQVGAIVKVKYDPQSKAVALVD
jgi:hypothetical protein